MTVPHDYSKDPPIVRLAEHAIAPGAIERQEAAGQRQLVASTVLPRKISGRGTDEESRQEFEALGFVFGEVKDDLFQEVSLPLGWKKEGSDHSMWSNVVDERGFKRVAVFYKAAFYDRSAHMGLSNVGWDFASKIIYTEQGDPPIDMSFLEKLTDDEFRSFLGTIAREIEDCDGQYSSARAKARKPRLEAALAEYTALRPALTS